MQDSERGDEKPVECGLRRNYSVDELMLLSKSALSRRCPSALSLEGSRAASNPWLLKLVAQPGGPPVNGETSLPSSNGSQEGRTFIRQDSNTLSDSGISLLPQRRSFTTGCQPSASLPSPQKILIRNQAGVFVTKEIPGRERDFRDVRDNSDRDRDGYNMRNNNYSRDYNNRNNNTPVNHRYGFHNANDRFDRRDRPNQDRGDFRRPDRFERDFRDNRDSRDDRSRPSNPDKQEESTYYLEHSDEDEPAWMEDGPTSRFDIMELKGFDDDNRGHDEDKPEEADKTESGTAAKGTGETHAVPAQEDKAPTPESPPVPEDRNAGGTAGSRFSALFSGMEMAAERNPEHSGPSPHDTVFGQEAGRNLLQMLQRKTQVAPGNPSVGQAKFKTLEDIEREHAQHRLQLEHEATMQQQATHSRFISPQYAGQSQPFSSTPPLTGHTATSPPAGLPEMPIPDDPSLHKLLNLSVQELTQMRDNNHFDHGMLLTLVQMKQRKEGLLKMLEMKGNAGSPPGVPPVQNPQMAYQPYPGMAPAMMQRTFPHYGTSMPPAQPYPANVPTGINQMHRYAQQRLPFGGAMRMGLSGQMPAAHAPHHAPAAPMHFPPNMISPHHPSFPPNQPFAMPAQELMLWQQQQQQRSAAAAHSRQMAERQEWVRHMQQQQSRMLNQMNSGAPVAPVRPSSGGNALLPTSVMRKTLQRSDTGSSSSSSSTPVPGGMLEALGGMERDGDGSAFGLYQQHQLPPPRTMEEEHQRFLMLQQHQQQMRPNPGSGMLPASLLNFQRITGNLPSYGDSNS